MTNFLFHAHSGLRYLVLLAAVVAIVYFTVSWITRRPPQRAGRVVMGAFVGLVDLQLLLGILLVISGIFYPALIGHIVMMLVAAAFAHGFSVASRRTADPRRSHGYALSGALLALGAIVAGIVAIGRPVL